MKYLIEGISTFILLLFTFLTFAIGINNFGILGCAITYAFIFGLFYYIFSNKKRVYLNPLLVLIDVQRKKITYKKF